MERKYQLVTNDTLEYENKMLYRIRALKDFSDVRKGDLGGFVESEANLSQIGSCWVYGCSKVLNSSVVSNDAKIYDTTVDDNSYILNNVVIHDSWIKKSRIRDNAEITASEITCSEISDNAVISDSCTMHHCTVSDDAVIKNAVYIRNANIGKYAYIDDISNYLVLQVVRDNNLEIITFYLGCDNNIVIKSKLFNDYISAVEQKLSDHVFKKSYIKTLKNMIKFAKSYFKDLA